MGPKYTSSLFPHVARLLPIFLSPRPSLSLIDTFLVASPGLAAEMSDSPTCPLGPRSQVGRQETKNQHWKSRIIKIEIHAEHCGTMEWAGGGRDRGDFRDILWLVQTDKAEWLPNASEQIPAFTQNWANVGPYWTEREHLGGGDAWAELWQHVH